MIYEGKIQGEGKKVAIIWSRFNEFVGSKLLSGALDAFIKHGTDEKDIDIYKVPGAFEITYILNTVIKKNYDAILCLGVLIKGDTPHFDYIAGQVARGISSISFQTDIPIIFGVLTTYNIEQAIARAGSKHGNKGYECAINALEMIDLKKNIQ